jgi:predicted nucleotide-binding protein
MKVFISWSGNRSKAIAEALHDWLPSVIQALKPWMSSYGIDKGISWASEITLQLQESRFGIICLTPENLDAPWLLFEAGALSKSLESTFVCPYLFGFEPADLRGPLVQFQATVANKEDTNKLIHTLNRALGESGLAQTQLDKAFDIWWPELERRLQSISTSKNNLETHKQQENAIVKSVTTPLHSDRELLEEIFKRLSPNPVKEEVEIQANNYVFIVHGHDLGTTEMVARLIERLGAQAIILHERPSAGRTVIEKFEEYSDVGYAVILMTADDQGGISNEPYEVQNKRARQNVILELGYFLGRLGRSKICALYQDGVEIPSDYSGVLYIKLDKEGAWRLQLAKELRTAGIRIDINNVL